jgi:hypothetical protein
MPSHEKKKRAFKTRDVIKDDGGIFAHYGNKEGHVRMLKKDRDNPDLTQERSARCLPVFVGMLSLAAVPMCRILTEEELLKVPR